MTQLTSANRTLCERQADFCAIFTNPARIRILLELGERERSVSDLAEKLQLPLPNLSQHLRLMRDRGCLRCHKQGKQVLYSITSPDFLQAMYLVRRGIESYESRRSYTAG